MRLVIPVTDLKYGTAFYISQPISTGVSNINNLYSRCHVGAQVF